MNVSYSYTDLDTGAEVTGSPRNYKCTTTACPNGGRAMVSAAHSSVPQDCFQLYTWLPVGNVIAVQGVSSAYHSTKELDSSKNLEMCLD